MGDELKVACVGDSITEGAGTDDPNTQSFPSQLRKLLGDGYSVTNYGISGTTMMKGGDMPYWNSEFFQQVQTTPYDIIFIGLGTNDGKTFNQGTIGEIADNAAEMITLLRGKNPGRPRVILLLPIVSPFDNYEIREALLASEVRPRLTQAAFATDCEFIDMHPLLLDHEDWIPDGVHPNAQGAGVIARRLYEAVVQPRDPSFQAFADAPYDSWHGYRRVVTTVNGREAQIVKPRVSAEGHPFTWRGRWWDVEPQTEIALLERGFHVVYIDRTELVGGPECIELSTAFHAYLVAAGLGAKHILFGFSLGGPYAMQWAATYPELVTAVYLDNALLDFRCIPFGYEHSPRDSDHTLLDAVMKAYNLTDEAACQAFHGSPIDRIPQLVRGKFPVLLLVADADTTCPPEDNSLPFAEAFAAAGGTCEVYHKPGFDHHPHSLPNPEYIVRFLLNASGLNYAPETKY